MPRRKRLKNLKTITHTRSARSKKAGRFSATDTFGDEQFWTEVLRMHEAIAATALAVGLKVDVEGLPREIIAALRAGEVDLTNPAVTIELVRLNAVVGVRGTVSETDSSGGG